MDQIAIKLVCDRMLLGKLCYYAGLIHGNFWLFKFDINLCRSSIVAYRLLDCELLFSVVIILKYQLNESCFDLVCII